MTKPANWDDMEDFEKAQYASYIPQNKKMDFHTITKIEEDRESGQISFSYGDRRKLDTLIKAKEWQKAKKLALETIFSDVDIKYFNSMISKLNQSDKIFFKIHGRELLSNVMKEKKRDEYTPTPQPETKPTPKTLTTGSRISTIFDIILIQIMLNCVVYIVAIYHQVTVEMTFIMLIFVVVIFILKRIKS
jgi:hypothetical protein